MPINASITKKLRPSKDRRSHYGMNLLLAEGDGAVLGIHAIHNGQRLQMVTQIPDDLAADLEALLDDDAQTLDGGTGGLCQRDQTLQGAAVGQEIIDDQQMIFFLQELLGHDDHVLVLVGKGLHLSDVHITINVDGLGLLGKDHRHAKFLCNEAGNADAGSLDGHDLGDGLVCEPAVELPTDLLHQVNIHLVIQKAVHLQHITGLHNTVFYDSFFQKIHA